MTQSQYTHDLAISAVSFDAMLVADLSDRLESRLRTSVAWSGHVARAVGDAVSPLLGDSSRVALILYQRLWGHDPTRVDAVSLRARLRQRPGSVVVASLDDAPLPDWLAGERACNLSVIGVGGLVQFALDAVAAAGGTLQRGARPAADPEVVVERPLRYEGPAPFLSQLRAHSSLRRELDAIGEELESRIHRSESEGDQSIELTVLPNRVTAKLGEIGLSFSWVPGRTGTVEDGRLLVIEWRGVLGAKKGSGAFMAATPIRERTYRAEASDPGSWRWRDDGPNGRACSTANLVGECVAYARVELTESPEIVAS